MTVIVCQPSSFPIRRILRCPVEGRRRRMAGYEQLWYGVTITCLGCGDSWTDGEMHPRPFKPRWRAEAMRSARSAWTAAAGWTKADHAEWLKDQMERA